ncbi:MAG: 4-hydroxythreonine-4-phosphate dehydrogenase PdxA [Nitrospiria bacterium]
MILTQDKPVIAITMGDPSGIGPEIIIKALEDSSIYEKCFPLVIGHEGIIHQTALRLGRFLKVHKICDLSSSMKPEPGYLFLLETGPAVIEALPGRPTRSCGQAAGSYIEKAAELALGGTIGAITTAPINKETLQNAGYPFPGHTEFFASLSKTENFAMLLVGGPLHIIFVTIHEPIARVPSLITKERVLKTIRLAFHEMRNLFGISHPVIGIASLNPHGGENGLFGKEELTEIIPAVEIARAEGIPVTQPVSPDTLFYKAYHKEYDAVVVMYHDQGLIPLKMVAFKQSVNVTLGLPFIRTSVDHGTAYDIAGKGIADPSSLKEAIFLAARLAELKKNHDHP